MSKKTKTKLFNIVKVNASLLKSHNNFVDYSYSDLKRNGLIVSVGDSQLFKFIRRIKDVEFNGDYVDGLYRKRNFIKKNSKETSSLHEISEIQKEIESNLFVPDIVLVRVDFAKKEYKELCKSGFEMKVGIDGDGSIIKYRRLCAGAGQLRKNCVFFVNEEIYEALELVMMCGLTPAKIGKINLAKFSAYYALYTSATNVVSRPRVCVIPDFKYTLENQDVTWIEEDENGNMDVTQKVIDIEQNAFDGSGIISPEMAVQWANDLGLDYTPTSFIVRSAWIKGLVSVFDFRKFSKEVAGKNVIIDAWGEEHKAENIDVILTTSQFKMYKKYSSWGEYNYYHHKFNHVYGVARVNKKKDDFMTRLNYQYVQSNNFSEESIKKLADYSLDWIKRVLSGDELATMLFLLNSHEEEDLIENIESTQNNYISKALMYDKSLFNDSFIRNRINSDASKKNKLIKIGKLFVEGSYDFVIPDLYALCEHAFGLEVKGLLKPKQAWCRRWVEKGSSVVSMMRSPLVAFSENQLMNIYSDKLCDAWFSHIQSGMMMNVWDTALMRASDADYDGDLVLTTDNQYVVDAVMDDLLPITYEKKIAKEQKLNHKSFADMDTKSFNSKIGFITNLASNFITMLSSYDEDSREYKEIRKRIDLLRYYQGSAIDATKGDVFVPPPKHWSNRQRFLEIPEDADKATREELKAQNNEIAFNNKICGDTKPYFFGYVYPNFMEYYKTHKRNYKKMARLMFGTTMQEVIESKFKDEDQKRFVRRYYKYMPLIVNKSVMNTLAMYADSFEFDNFWAKKPPMFDYTVLMSENYNISDTDIYTKIKDLISDFNSRYKSANSEIRALYNTGEIYMSSDEWGAFNNELNLMMRDCEKELADICEDRTSLVDYLIHIYYNHYKSYSRNMLWNSFGDTILQNVKSKSTHVSYPIFDENGTEYLGKRYSMKVVEVKNDCI